MCSSHSVQNLGKKRDHSDKNLNQLSKNGFKI